MVCSVVSAVASVDALANALPAAAVRTCEYARKREQRAGGDATAVTRARIRSALRTRGGTPLASSSASTSFTGGVGEAAGARVRSFSRDQPSVAAAMTAVRARALLRRSCGGAAGAVGLQRSGGVVDEAGATSTATLAGTSDTGMMRSVHFTVSTPRSSPHTHRAYAPRARDPWRWLHELTTSSVCACSGEARRLPRQALVGRLGDVRRQRRRPRRGRGRAGRV